MIDFDVLNDLKGGRMRNMTSMAAEDLKKGDRVVSFFSHGNGWWRKARDDEMAEGVMDSDEDAEMLVIVPVHNHLRDRRVETLGHVDMLSRSMQTMYADLLDRMEDKRRPSFNGFTFHFSALVIGLLVAKVVVSLF